MTSLRRSLLGDEYSSIPGEAEKPAIKAAPAYAQQAKSSTPLQPDKKHRTKIAALDKITQLSKKTYDSDVAYENALFPELKKAVEHGATLKEAEIATSTTLNLTEDSALKSMCFRISVIGTSDSAFSSFGQEFQKWAMLETEKVKLKKEEAKPAASPNTPTPRQPLPPKAQILDKTTPSNKTKETFFNLSTITTFKPVVVQPNPADPNQKIVDDFDLLLRM